MFNVNILKVDASRTLEDKLLSKEKVARFNKQHFVVGLKETLKALKKDQVTSLIIAEDVEVYFNDSRVKPNQSEKYTCIFFKSKHALGKHVGINVNATIVALIK